MRTEELRRLLLIFPLYFHRITSPTTPLVIVIGFIDGTKSLSQLYQRRRMVDCGPYLTLMTEDAPQRDYPFHLVFNSLRWVRRTGASWRWMPLTCRPGRSSISSPGAGSKPASSSPSSMRKGKKAHPAVDTLGPLLASCVATADEPGRAQVSFVILILKNVAQVFA